VTTCRGQSLIGLLIAMACLLGLAVILLNSLNKAMRGAGSVLPGTVASYEDRQYLIALHQALVTAAYDTDGRFLVPSELSRSRDGAEDTTAALYSAMIAEHYTVPGQLISGNEYNPNVWRDDDYDYTAYRPSEGTYWDPSFAADLDVESNTSFAHVPLFARRLDNAWRFTAGSRTALLGNRGPANGVEDPNSFTYGEDGRWRGHIVFGDGHVEFLEVFTPPGLVLETGAPDNVFAMEEGPRGRDVILSFTLEMTDEGPVLQHD
jgi:prepilin-type processing-associated H-X9-DG protein